MRFRAGQRSHRPVGLQRTGARIHSCVGHGRQALFSLAVTKLFSRAAVGRRRSMWHRLASFVQQAGFLAPPGMPFLRPRFLFQAYVRTN